MLRKLDRERARRTQKIVLDKHQWRCRRLDAAPGFAKGGRFWRRRFSVSRVCGFYHFLPRIRFAWSVSALGASITSRSGRRPRCECLSKTSGGAAITFVRRAISVAKAPRILRNSLVPSSVQHSGLSQRHRSESFWLALVFPDNKEKIFTRLPRIFEPGKLETANK